MVETVVDEVPSVQILGRGPDTIVGNINPTDDEGNVIRQQLSKALQEELNDLKQRAQLAEEPVPTRWVFDGSNLLIRDKGESPFKWILYGAKFSLAISRGVKVGLIGQVRLSSEYLWEHQHCLDKAISDVLLLLTDIFGPNIYVQLAQIDLCIDLTGWDIGSVCFKQQFIYRAAKTGEFPEHEETSRMVTGPERTFERWRRVTGLPFGMRTSAVSCLIYDKTDEIKYQSPKKVWFHDLWRANGWDGASPVWRVEFRFRRPALHEFGLESMFEVLDHMEDLWTYAAGHAGGDADGWPDGWLRYVVPSEDSNRSRWPVHPLWQVVQGAFAAAVVVPEGQGQAVTERTATSGTDGTAVDVAVPVLAAPTVLDLRPFIRQRKREVNMRQALAAVAGYTSTIEAWRRGKAGTEDVEPGEAVEHDISDTFYFLYKNVTAYLDEKERDFAEIVQKKRVIYHLDETAA